MKSNFSFLEKAWPVLAQIGNTAENYMYHDPNSCLFKMGMFGEKIVKLIFELDNLEEPTFDNTHANRIKVLKQEGLSSRLFMVYILLRDIKSSIFTSLNTSSACSPRELRSTRNNTLLKR